MVNILNSKSRVRVYGVHTTLLIFIFTIQNRQKGMQVLRARIYEQKRLQAVKEISDLRREQTGTGERSEKIRTYNYPQVQRTSSKLTCVSCDSNRTVLQTTVHT